MPEYKRFRIFPLLWPLAFLLSCASSAPKPSETAQLADNAESLLRQANEKFEHAAALGDVQSVGYLVSAHTYGIGVREDYPTALANIHLFNRIGARLAAGSGQGEEYLAKGQELAKGLSAYEMEVLEKRLDGWFKRSSEVPKASTDSLRDVGMENIRAAFQLHKRAADSGYLPSIEYVAKACRYGIGVEGEIGMLAAGEYLFNRIGARLAGDTPLGWDFQARVEAKEQGKSPDTIKKSRAEVDAWLEKRPWIRPATK